MIAWRRNKFTAHKICEIIKVLMQLFANLINGNDQVSIGLGSTKLFIVTEGHVIEQFLCLLTQRQVYP